MNQHDNKKLSLFITKTLSLGLISLSLFLAIHKEMYLVAFSLFLLAGYYLFYPKMSTKVHALFLTFFTLVVGYLVRLTPFLLAPLALIVIAFIFLHFRIQRVFRPK